MAQWAQKARELGTENHITECEGQKVCFNVKSTMGTKLGLERKHEKMYCLVPPQLLLPVSREVCHMAVNFTEVSLRKRCLLTFLDTQDLRNSAFQESKQ